MSEGDFIPALRVSALTRFYDPVVGLTTRERRFKQGIVAQASPAAGERSSTSAVAPGRWRC